MKTLSWLGGRAAWLFLLLAFIANFWQSEHLPDAVLGQDAEAWTKLWWIYGFTLVCSAVPAYWFTNWFERLVYQDEPASLTTWVMMQLVSPVVLTLVIIGGGTFARLVWSCL